MPSAGEGRSELPIRPPTVNDAGVPPRACLPCVCLWGRIRSHRLAFFNGRFLQAAPGFLGTGLVGISRDSPPRGASEWISSLWLLQQLQRPLSPGWSSLPACPFPSGAWKQRHTPPRPAEGQDGISQSPLSAGLPVAAPSRPLGWSCHCRRGDRTGQRCRCRGCQPREHPCPLGKPAIEARGFGQVSPLLLRQA